MRLLTPWLQPVAVLAVLPFVALLGVPLAALAPYLADVSTRLAPPGPLWAHRARLSYDAAVHGERRR